MSEPGKRGKNREVQQAASMGSQRVGRDSAREQQRNGDKIHRAVRSPLTGFGNHGKLN